MPPDDGGTNIAASKSMTILLNGGDKLFYYSGDFETANIHHNVIATSSNNFGVVVRARQRTLEAKGIDRHELVLLIKPTRATSYESIIAIIDELRLNDVSRYAFIDPTPPEIQSCR